ncbi:DUF3592 domain-containing protein [Spongiivirga citrea]|uniref:DUF3592 domain-containing protein n=1 Tax=Spongiivirga citrea TaxID=1481457 RepID=A0A6M0CJW6_9FLAO|nr:DUF3592 domain-containing protein [Spongiivirga citrea]NER16264.1 DUF3592 domain-containing protein [Spongiivirga citrea]
MDLNKKRHIDEAIKLLKKSQYQYQIKNHLKKKGLDDVSIAEIIEEATAIHKTAQGKLRRILWIALTVITFVIFYFLIPTNIYNVSPFIISTIGAIFFTIFLLQSIVNFESFDELNTKDKSKTDWRHSITPFFVVPAIIMLLVFNMHFSASERAELKEDGITVKGVIVDGKAYESRRGGTYSVTVKFKTKTGQAMRVSEGVSESEFDNLYKGQKVQLVYSKKNPSLIEILTSDSDIASYTGIESRDITPEDLMNLINKENHEVGKSLNEISYSWRFDKQDSVWINEKKSLAVKVKQNETIRYISFNHKSLLFGNELEKIGFNQVENEDKKLKLFEGEQHYAAVETTLQDMRVGTIITVQNK